MAVLSILYVWCFPFVSHTQNSQDTKVMEQTTVHVQLRKVQKLTVLPSQNNQDIKVRKWDYCTVGQDKAKDTLI